MQFLVYVFSYPFLILISVLPFRLLYLFSDFVFFLVYYVFGYRKKTVRENLLLAFPHMDDKQRRRIEKKSFRHLCDMFLETIKTMSISVREIEERFEFKNLDVYLKLEKEGKSIALVCAHYASYEWVISMNSKISFQGFAIYKKINNEYFDRLIKRIRSRFKANLINSKKTIEVIEKNHLSGIKGVYGFASDQSPQVKPNIYWSQFMGVKVPVHTGAEMLSKRFDMNMIYLKVIRVKRGYYEAEFEILSDNVRSVPNYEITETFLRKVEKQVYEAPEFYLWTHKRWKHRYAKNLT